jgi:hypothetical protein
LQEAGRVGDAVAICEQTTWAVSEMSRAHASTWACVHVCCAPLAAAADTNALTHCGMPPGKALPKPAGLQPCTLVQNALPISVAADWIDGLSEPPHPINIDTALATKIIRAEILMN